MPILFKNGESITGDQKEALRQLGIELEQKGKETHAIVDHEHEKIDLNKKLKNVQFLVDHDPENKLFKFIFSGVSQGREFKIKFNSLILTTILIYSVSLFFSLKTDQTILM